jgi:hypothetical protein
MLYRYQNNLIYHQNNRFFEQYSSNNKERRKIFILGNLQSQEGIENIWKNGYDAALGERFNYQRTSLSIRKSHFLGGKG